MIKRRVETQHQLRKFLLEEGWLEDSDEFVSGHTFRGDLKFTNREMDEMLFMVENEFDILFTEDEQKSVSSIGDLVALIVKKTA